MEPLIRKSVNRKLTAILSADAVGYSRLMGENEEATIKSLNACRIDQLLRIMPNASVGYYEKTSYLQRDADLKRYINSLRKAGLPE